MQALKICILLLWTGIATNGFAGFEERDEGDRCQLSGGEFVPEGWFGKDTGDNYCNSCSCQSGLLACTKMGCPPLDEGSCVFPDGTVVPAGWLGKGRGENHCNTCACRRGDLVCTLKACHPKQGSCSEDPETSQN